MNTQNIINIAFAMALAFACATASYAASDGSARGRAYPPPPQSKQIAQKRSTRASDAIQQELRGRVVSVADGDTITVLDASNTQHKIRLFAIDAPERSQAFGQKSKEQLSGYVFGKDVTVQWKSKDKYGRILGTIFVGSTDINLQMVRDGYAHHYKRYDSTPVYAAAEADARQNRRGLWADPNPISPEDYRHRVSSATPSHMETRHPAALGQNASSQATTLPLPLPRAEYRPGSALPVSARTAAPVNDTYPDTGFWLSTNSNKRHNRKCENYRKTLGYPCSASEGTPCGKCGG